jgi:hypothetical protein
VRRKFYVCLPSLSINTYSSINMSNPNTILAHLEAMKRNQMVEKDRARKEKERRQKEAEVAEAKLEAELAEVARVEEEQKWLEEK